MGSPTQFQSAPAERDNQTSAARWWRRWMSDGNSRCQHEIPLMLPFVDVVSVIAPHRDIRFANLCLMIALWLVFTSTYISRRRFVVIGVCPCCTPFTAQCVEPPIFTSSFPSTSQPLPFDYLSTSFPPQNLFLVSGTDRIVDRLVDDDKNDKHKWSVTLPHFNRDLG